MLNAGELLASTSNHASPGSTSTNQNDTRSSSTHYDGEHTTDLPRSQTREARCPRMTSLLISTLSLNRFHCQELPVSANPAIVNGVAAAGAAFPWMVSLRMDYPGYVFANSSTAFYHRFCGGSLIESDPITILTAAHCVDAFNATDSGSILNGGYDVRLYADVGRTKGPHIDNEYDERNDSYITVAITAFAIIHIHPEWNSSDIMAGFDIAMIVIDDEQHFPDGYTVANLPMYEAIENECCSDIEGLTTIGLGLSDESSEGGQPADTLERIEMEYHPSDECLDYLEAHFEQELGQWWTNDQICARGDDVDGCHGDSGGPLFRTNGDEIEVVGVTSYVLAAESGASDFCNSAHPDGHDLPSFFTSVAHYVDFIEETVYGHFDVPEQEDSSDDSSKNNTDDNDNDVSTNQMCFNYLCVFFVLFVFC